MDFIEAKRRFAEAVNRLSISQTDKHAILGIIDFFQTKDNDNNKPIIGKTIKMEVKAKTTNQENLVYWDNDDNYFEEIRVVTKALVCDKPINVNDIVIDNNKTEYRITAIEKEGRVAILNPIN